ncbi:MAG TPA: hypothetical protein VFX72_03895 [Usitatibacteraceae bacterium]|nr:hypothetical protein [Usitatibacteraceae bacterium]
MIGKASLAIFAALALLVWAALSYKPKAKREDAGNSARSNAPYIYVGKDENRFAFRKPDGWRLTPGLLQSIVPEGEPDRGASMKIDVYDAEKWARAPGFEENFPIGENCTLAHVGTERTDDGKRAHIRRMTCVADAELDLVAGHGYLLSVEERWIHNVVMLSSADRELLDRNRQVIHGIARSYRLAPRNP